MHIAQMTYILPSFRNPVMYGSNVIRMASSWPKAWTMAARTDTCVSGKLIRNRRNLIAIVLAVEFLLILPFMALVVGLERRLFLTDRSFFPAGIAWVALYIFTRSRLRTYPCPRCAKNFFSGFFATPETMLGRNCAHCGLRKYAEE
jgi:hypothetical protein